MLVLGRKKEDRIVIKTRLGELIEITLVDIDRNQVRIGIDADESTKIIRKELLETAGWEFKRKKELENDKRTNQED